MQRARYGERGAELSIPSQTLHPLSTSACSPSRKLSKYCRTCGNFLGDLLHRHDGLNHWPLVIHSTSCPFLSQRSGLGAENSNPLITWMDPPAIDLHAEAIRKPSATSDLITYKKTLMTSGDHKCFRSCMSGKGNGSSVQERHT